ncbi:hypothetical protein ACA910_006689 [Epithemia clementina (nom. ined.)]
MSSSEPPSPSDQSATIPSSVIAYETEEEYIPPSSLVNKHNVENDSAAVVGDDVVESETTTVTTDNSGGNDHNATNKNEGENNELGNDASKLDHPSATQPTTTVVEEQQDGDEQGVVTPTSTQEDESFDASLNTPNNDKTTTMTLSEREQRQVKVLFLSSDTGGGHRASAESLAKQFELLYPGTTYDMVDLVEEDFGPPYNSLVSVYKHLSAHPSQWKLLYTISNSRGFEMIADAHFKLMCERAIRKRIKKYNPDVVISVHPMMTNVPVLSCKRISNETGRHLPMFTVVTDLGSAHCLWFANGVEKMFVGSERVKELAMARGKVPEEKLVLSGLPIRHDFAVQAEKLGDRMSKEGQNYQHFVRAELQLPYTHRKTLLVMGGGEGVGSLSNIVDALYVELVSQGIDALVLVVCGRNEKLRQELENRDWALVFHTWQSAKNRDGVSKTLMSFGDTCGSGMTSNGCMEGVTVSGSIRRMLSSGSLTVGNMMSSPDPLPISGGIGSFGGFYAEEKKADESVKPAVETILHGDNTTATSTEEPNEPQGEQDGLPPTVMATGSEGDSVVVDDNTKAAGDVHVVGLGFVTRMAEYMVAADILISKAGPGTISEAAALSLPVMLTSYLPGQEEGNVDYVIDGGFGAYVNDSDPIGIAEEICMWLSDDDRRAKLSAAAKAHGAPFAARDIVRQIGDSTIKWKEINHEKEMAEADNAVKTSNTNTSIKSFHLPFRTWTNGGDSTTPANTD